MFDGKKEPTSSYCNRAQEDEQQESLGATSKDNILYYGFSHDHSIVVHLQEQGFCLGIVSSIDPSQVDECTLWTNPWISTIGPQMPDMSNPCLCILSCLYGHIEI